MNSPQISVVIPTYNRGAAILNTIESALQQDLPPDEVEIIVVDDGSTDDTWGILQRSYGSNPRVRLFAVPNAGVAQARNLGLQEALGEFIAFLDHDDLWLPQKLRLQREVLRQNLGIGVVLCLWHDRTPSGEIIPGHQILQKNRHWNLPHGLVFDRLLRNNFIVSMTIPMMRTALMREVDGFDASMVPCDDWDLWIRLSQRCKFGVVREVCAIYQRHEGQQSSDEKSMSAASLRLKQKYLLPHFWMGVKHPRAMWIAWSISYFNLTQHPFYHQARVAIASRDWKGVIAVLMSCQKKFPLILMTPQWLYVLIRFLKRDSSPF